MQKLTKKLGIILAALMLAILAPTSTLAASKGPIIVGSKALSESRTVSEIYAIALEHAGYKVTRRQNIANNVIFNATQKKQIDVYPDYTGTIVEAYLQKDGRGKTSAQMAAIAKKGIQKKGLTTFKYAPGDNRQGVAVTTKVAKKYHIYNLSELQAHSRQIRFASQGEFEKRADALPGMNKLYGKYHFKSMKDYDSSLFYRIMEEGKADAAPVSTTDGPLASRKFTLLKDNKGLWPPYNLVPVANKQTVKRYTKMEKTLNAVDAKLTTKQLIAMNKKVSSGQNYRTVAKQWYQKHME